MLEPYLYLRNAADQSPVLMEWNHHLQNQRMVIDAESGCIPQERSRNLREIVIHLFCTFIWFPLFAWVW